MKFYLSKHDYQKVISLLDRKEDNIFISGILNELCFNQEIFNNINFSNDPKEFNQSCIDAIIDFYGFDREDKELMKTLSTGLQGVFKNVHLNRYRKNAYATKIHPEEQDVDVYRLHYLNYPMNTFFPLDEIEVKEEFEYLERPSIGISNTSYDFLTLSKGNNIWMCITPNEINTMWPHISKAKGNIVVFGLGLGYYVYMAHLKEEVKSITIVEKSKEISRLFNRFILPNFEHPEKVRTVRMDAFEFIETNYMKRFDYAFFDLWYNAEDGLPMYLRLRKYNLPIPSSYWLEEAIICMYRRCVLTVIEEAFQGYTDENYQKAENPIDEIINDIYFKTKKKEFSKYEDINNFLSRYHLRKFMGK